MGQLHGHVTCALTGALLQKRPTFGLKFNCHHLEISIIFEKWDLHFNFALGPANGLVQSVEEQPIL